MRLRMLCPSLVGAGMIAACASVPVTGDPAVEVVAFAETVPVGTANADAADDPAIWHNASNPAASLIVGTDKKAGLHVYGLDGSQKSFLEAGLVNNVDLVELANGTILVAASDRSDPVTAHVYLASLDGESGELTPLGRHPVGPGEGYGLCMAHEQEDGPVRVFSPVKDGSVVQTTLIAGESGWQASSVLLHKLATQPEGCVHDARTEMLYVGEENAGIWAFDLARGGAPELVAAIDNAQLVADVEGLALAPEGTNGGYLVASSQGDNAYAVFRLPDLSPLGRFRISAGSFGAAEETDGIALDVRSFGSTLPAGVFVAQDGVNGTRAQNFKFVSWADVKAALRLP